MMYLFHELNLILTIYNTVILVRSIIKFLDRNFIFIEIKRKFKTKGFIARRAKIIVLHVIL